MNGPSRLATYLSLLILVLGGLAAIDALTALPGPAAADGGGRSDLPRGRVFVLVIDSLRYQTAISPALMPHLTALRARGAFARVIPTRDAVTVPCLRAAFTGRDRTRVFGFVENFLKGNAGLESLFTQLAAAGRSAAVFSDGAFDQFGDRGITRASNGDPSPESDESDDRRDHVDEQNATLPLALADYREGKHDLVVLHVTYTDHVAHEVGIDAPLYAQRYHAADALVERLDRELPAEDTLLVMGDHGHDAQGRHAVGLDVPTYALYRGPRFVAGADLGSMAIRDHRYLLGYALGLPLAPDYAGAQHPNALHGNYTAAAHGGEGPSPGVPAARRTAYFGVALVLAALFALWFSAQAASPLTAATTALPALVALGLGGLGAAFPHLRPLIHEPAYATLFALWLALWSGACAVTWRTRRLELGSALLALPLWVAVPTVYRYGAPGAMEPAWLGWLACVMLALGRRPPLAAAAGLFAMLLPFGLAESSDFRFDEWVLWPPAFLPSGFAILALLAKLIVLVPPSASTRDRACGVVATLLLSAAQLGLIAPPVQLLTALLLLAAAVWMRGQALSTTTLITALLLLHHYAVRVPASAYHWQDCLLAALVLSARMIRPLPAASRSFARACLLLFAFFASGWVSFAWTLHRLEWRFLYDFWSAAFVESHVAAFAPLLIGRFALPLIAARALLTRELAGEDDARALGLAWLLTGSKAASLMFWCYGIAFVSVDSDVYLEAVQETCLACALLLGLL